MEIRKFDTGATKSSNANKPQYDKYLSPIVIQRFGQYMLHHQKQPDGSIRAGDNWKKSIPLDAYMESTFRHFTDLWLHHQGFHDQAVESLEEALCALFFNIQGYLHETIKQQHEALRTPRGITTEASAIDRYILGGGYGKKSDGIDPRTISSSTDVPYYMS